MFNKVSTIVLYLQILHFYFVRQISPHPFLPVPILILRTGMYLFDLQELNCLTISSSIFPLNLFHLYNNYSSLGIYNMLLIFNK